MSCRNNFILVRNSNVCPKAEQEFRVYYHIRKLATRLYKPKVKACEEHKYLTLEITTIHSKNKRVNFSLFSRSEKNLTPKERKFTPLDNRNLRISKLKYLIFTLYKGVNKWANQMLRTLTLTLEWRINQSVSTRFFEYRNICSYAIFFTRLPSLVLVVLHLKTCQFRSGLKKADLDVMVFSCLEVRLTSKCWKNVKLYRI